MSIISEIKIQKKAIFCKAAALFFPFLLTAQTPQAYYQNKLNTYFSSDREVKNFVSITENGISVYSNAYAKATDKKPEMKLSWYEISLLKSNIRAIPEKELEKLLLQKKDSLLFYIKKDSLGSYNPPILSFKGMKIAIDPGHIGGSYEMGEAESRCMKLTLDSSKQVQLVEGNLTFFTAMVLKKKLEKQGALVMLTRSDTGISSMGISFFEWKKKIKNRAYLDSLLKCGLISEKKIKAMHARLPDKTLFEKIFGSIDLAERARKINTFKPDITVVIHYNVNEKNTGWCHTTSKDFVMAFVPGCI
ncbi:MAG: N-acetylmuramoyl-L-alanine amidase, partial [Candidatus Dormibacteria bacterium]